MRPAALPALALALLAIALSAAPAGASCGGPRHAGAVRPKGATGRAPLILGDSTMLYAAPMLGAMGLEADAQGCRQFVAGVGILAARRRAGTLPPIAVLALGANAAIADADVERALALLGPQGLLGLVTPPRSPGSVAAMRRAARRHPDQVLLIDWVAFSAGSGWFSGDGLHVTMPGARAFAGLIRRSIAPYAFPPAHALRLPAPGHAARSCGHLRRAGHWVSVAILRGATRVTCERALALARAPRMDPAAGWRTYDWRRVPAGGWSWVTARADLRVVVATVPGRVPTAPAVPPPAPAPPPAPPAT